ncbi:hypothetical protein D3Z47_10455 [Lachnospiraceae bacterium]|nr:hypothetical protein [Lachnospiraceae bacterium]
MLSDRCATHLAPKGYDMPNKGDVAGDVDHIRCKYHAKWGMQMMGMIFQTRSRENPYTYPV